MRGVYIFAGVMVVIALAALFYLLLAKLGVVMFAKKKEKDEQPR